MSENTFSSTASSLSGNRTPNRRKGKRIFRSINNKQKHGDCHTAAPPMTPPKSPTSPFVKFKSKLNHDKRFKSPWSRHKNKNITVKHSPMQKRSEKTIIGNDTFDGIEISLNEKGMELTHVLGNDDDGDSVVSPLKSMDGIMDHTTKVYWKGDSLFHRNNHENAMDSDSDDDDESDEPKLHFLEHQILVPRRLKERKQKQNKMQLESLRYHAICDADADTVSKKHRVPIQRRASDDVHIVEMDYDEQMKMLESQPIRTEKSLARKELTNLWTEMKAIEVERMELDVDGKVANQIRWRKCTKASCNAHFDIDMYLDSSDTKKIFNNVKALTDTKVKKYLRSRRGTCVHAGFSLQGNNDICKMFATKCGGNPNSCAPHSTLKDCVSFLNLFGICVVSTSSNAIRHMSIMESKDEEAIQGTYFISKDDGRSNYGGTLPARLIERIDNEDGLSFDSAMRKIKYISTGPNDSYFVELFTGHSFWSIGKYDEAFQTVMDTVHVHRIAFGSFQMDSSWIIISREGQLAWRNIPPRLHNLLKSRKPEQAAPCEVSLGHEGTYFIKFLDGEIDYMLPTFVDCIASRILERGAAITNISLNVNCPNAFIIRHTEL